MSDPNDALVAQLNQPGSSSKKFRVTVMGLIAVLFVFTVSVAAIIVKPEVAPSVASVASIVVTAIGGLVAVYSGSQAAVDWNTTSALAKKI